MLSNNMSTAVCSCLLAAQWVYVWNLPTERENKAIRRNEASNQLEMEPNKCQGVCSNSESVCIWEAGKQNRDRGLWRKVSSLHGRCSGFHTAVLNTSDTSATMSWKLYWREINMQDQTPPTTWQWKEKCIFPSSSPLCWRTAKPSNPGEICKNLWA